MFNCTSECDLGRIYEDKTSQKENFYFLNFFTIPILNSKKNEKFSSLKTLYVKVNQVY